MIAATQYQTTSCSIQARTMQMTRRTARVLSYVMHHGNQPRMVLSKCLIHPTPRISRLSGEAQKPKLTGNKDQLHGEHGAETDCRQEASRRGDCVNMIKIYLRNFDNSTHERY